MEWLPLYQTRKNFLSLCIFRVFSIVDFIYRTFRRSCYYNPPIPPLLYNWPTLEFHIQRTAPQPHYRCMYSFLLIFSDKFWEITAGFWPITLWFNPVGFGKDFFSKMLEKLKIAWLTLVAKGQNFLTRILKSNRVGVRKRVLFCKS